MRRSGWSWRWFVPVLAPALIGALFFVLGHPERASVLWVISGIVLVLVFAGVPVDEYVARLAVAVAHGVGVVATGLVGLVLIGGGGVVRLFRRDPLTPRSRRGNGWQPAAGAAAAQRLATAPFGVERVGTSDTTARSGLGAAARSALLAVGADHRTSAHRSGRWPRVGECQRAGTAGGGRRHSRQFHGQHANGRRPRAQLPAMAAYPWADEYLREVQTTPNSYWPFTESRPRDFQGKYVTIDGWARRSYVPADLPDDAPVIWMFGGSTTWGEGQRDEHTIASDIAKLSEEDGTPVRIVDYGQRGWTHFQEMILFEQLLAAGDAPIWRSSTTARTRSTRRRWARKACRPTRSSISTRD